MSRITQSLAMGVGAAGAMVDVTSYMDLAAGVSRNWGRESEFEDAVPGQFSFTLDNSDGRFTPGNASSALVTTVTEGMSVCWQLGSRLVAGTVQAIEPTFPGGESAWAQVTITCDDMLGNAARHELASLDDAAVREGIVTWPMSDATGSLVAVGSSPIGTAPYLNVDTSGGGAVAFGNTTSGIPDAPSAVAITTGASSGTPSMDAVGPFPALSYPAGVVGALGFWALCSSDVHGFTVVLRYLSTLPGLATWSLKVQPAGASSFIADGLGGTAIAASPLIDFSTPHYVSSYVTMGGTTAAVSYTVEVFVDGVSGGTSSYTPSPAVPRPTIVQPAEMTMSSSVVGAVGPGSVTTIARITHSIAPINDGLLSNATAADRISALAATAPELELDTLPTLSTAIYAGDDPGGDSTLDALNNVIRAEQGHIYTATTGTLTAPTQKVKVRERDRPSTVTYSFNAETEASGATDFVRDITNMLATITVDGPITSAVYTDSSLTSRASAKNASESLPLRDYTDLYTWGTDRVARGANVVLRAASLTIDAFTTPTDRSSSLLALVPGDRIQITGLPSTQLGFSTSDGWLLGVDEHQSLTEHTFTLYLQPVLLRPIILDTDVLTAGGNLSLTSSITNSTTSISVTSSDGTLLSTAGGDYPQKFRLENEVITATAVSGASSPQTMTATRASTDPITGLATTAAAHAAAVQVEVADPAYLAF